ncbi:MAG: holo-ACP synthase [Fusobacteriaceae bacterium]
MIFGVGTDIIEIYRMKKAISNPKFKEKIFTENELKEILSKGDRAETYAGKFSAKEAVAKSFGTGIRDFELTELEILNDSQGKPIVFLLGNLSEKYKEYKIELSISHCKEYATATAVIFKI